MEGITILNQTLHEGAIIDSLFMIGLILVGAGLFLGIAGAFMSSCKIKVIPYIFLSIALIFFAVGLAIGIFGPREQIVRYQVLIDETVSFVEFNDRYEIISQDGIIYTIQEREP
jgi:hypothetical protein